jgi:lipopolysaccharide biosynthesis glycosyltransferase
MVNVNIFINHQVNDIDKLSTEKIIQYFNNARINWTYVDDSVFNGLPKHANGYATYYRLLSIDLTDWDKALCLDVDTIVTANLFEFFSLDLQKNYLAGVLDLPLFFSGIENVLIQNRLKLLGVSDPIIYINAGVILFNLDQIRLNFSLDEVLDYGKNNSPLLFRCDQDLINKIFYPRIKVVSPSYNYQAYMPLLRKYPGYTPQIIHGLWPKPWQKTNSNFWVESIYQSVWNEVNALLDRTWSQSLLNTETFLDVIKNHKFPHYGSLLDRYFPKLVMKNVLRFEGRDRKQMIAQSNS